MRIPALDFTKGTLVLLMVLYHWINYFVSTVGAVYTYLRFITPSFIFLAGFLIATVYPVRYGWGNSRASKRLVYRGLKLLALFTLLNLAANVMFASNYKGAMPGVEGFLRNASAIYLSGNARSSFWMLVPISYLLMISAGIVLLEARYKYVVHLSCAGLLICVAAMNLFGHSSANLDMIAIGMLGMVAGLHPIDKLDRYAGGISLVLGLNIGYIVAISVWDVIYILQVIGVCLNVLLIYLIGRKTATWTRIQGQINLLGEYSLFGYVAQIAVLQVLQRTLSYLHLQAVTLWIVSFIGAFILTIVTVNVLRRSREQIPLIDKLYKVAFS